MNRHFCNLVGQRHDRAAAVAARKQPAKPFAEWRLALCESAAGRSSLVL
jgi:hypothetical protein